MTQIKERIEGHYEVEEIPYGRVYRWTAGHALIECENCGQLIIVDPVTTACPECDTDYAAVARGLEGKRLGEDEAYQPEQRAYEEWLTEEQARPYLRHYEWLELQDLLQ